MGLLTGVNVPPSGQVPSLQPSVDSLGANADLAALAELFQSLAFLKGTPNVGGAPFANSLTTGFMPAPPVSFGFPSGPSGGATQAVQALEQLFSGGSAGFGQSIQAQYGSPPYGGASFNGYAPNAGGGRAMRNSATSASTSSSGNPFNIMDTGGAYSGGVKSMGQQNPLYALGNNQANSGSSQSSGS
jgi:hypothetical protein